MNNAPQDRFLVAPALVDAAYAQGDLLMSETRLAEWLKSIEGLAKTLLTASGALLAIYVAVQGKLVSVAEDLGVQKDMAQYAGRAGSLLLVLPLLWFLVRSYRRFAKASRLEQPDRFTLSATTPESLIGRAPDLEKLLDCVRKNRVVLLDGESGCGKSALVAAGLVPRLTATTTELLPALMRDWGDDWVRGPLASALGALFDVLTQEQRLTLGWTSSPDLAADASTLAAELAKRIEAVRTQLGRRLLLIADQFDDYQARHRERFIDAGGNWLKPDALVAANPFWALTCTQLRAGALHLLVVTRADTASGLSCVRFVDEAITADRHLPRVDMEFLRPLLERIAPADAVPAVVSHADQGWWELRDRLEADLKLQGAVLMQQVRTVLLGLRQLPILNVATYRRAGGLRGTESRVITRAIQRTTEAIGGGEATSALVRRLLATLVLPGSANQAAKAQRESFEDLVSLVGSAEVTRTILLHLQAEEIVWASRDGTWRLDHDYLAHAVLEDAKQADRWGVALREGLERYRHADDTWGARWSALLSSHLQIRLMWERTRGRLRYGEAAAYARLSLCKPFVLIVALGATAMGVHFWNTDRQLSLGAAGIYDRFGGSTERLGVLDAWRAPRAVRDRLDRLVHEDESRLERALRSNWPLAQGGLEAATLQQSARELRERLARETNPNLASWFAQAYAAVATKLSEPVAQQEATVLRERLAREADSDLASSLALAYAAVATKLSEPAVQQATTAIRERMMREITPHATNFTPAYAAVITERSVAEVQQAAPVLRESMGLAPDSYHASNFALAYATVAAKLSEPAARLEAATLRDALARLTNEYPKFDIKWTKKFIDAHFSEVTSQQDARAMYSSLTRVPQPYLPFDFALAYAAVAAKLTEPAAQQEATVLRAYMAHETNSALASCLALAYAAVATKLTEPAAQQEATALNERLARETNSALASNFAQAYAAVATKLSGPTAQQAARALRERMEQETNPSLESRFAQAYATATAALSELETQQAATTLRERMTRETNSYLASNFAQAYAAVATKLSEPAVQLAATTLRVYMAHETNSYLASRFIPAYTAVATKLSELAAQQEAVALSERLARETDSAFASNFAQAYAAVAAKLSEPAAQQAVDLLGERLARETRSGIVSGFAEAYATVEAKIVEDSIAHGDLAATAEAARKILVMTGHPYLSDASHLLAALRSASGRDFENDVGAAVEWWRTTYKGDPATLRPPPLAAS